MSELRDLAQFVHSLSWSAVPQAARHAALLTVVDTVGVGVGARANPQILSVLATMTDLDTDTVSAPIWGQNRRSSVLTAAFLNAQQGHTLEMDDVHTNSKVHIGTVVTPAVWSLAWHGKKTGRELLEAVLCGYEVCARVGMALGVAAHRGQGWHATATAGVVGCAAACARIMGLSVDQIVWAMGMAAQISGGTWAFLGDGASCKVFNPAIAATNGIRCALMAKAGMSGPEHALTAEDGGMLPAMSDNYNARLANKDLGTVWQVTQMDNKPYPCCRSTHCTVDGTLALMQQYGITADQVDHVEVRTYLVGNKQCGMSQGSLRPTKPVEAKFSSPYTVACALLFGKVGLREFEQDVIDNPKVQELLARVKIVTDDAFTQRYPDHWGCRVIITLRDGTVREHEIRDASGSVDSPLTEEQAVRKIHGILARVMPDTDADRVIQSLLALESAPSLPEV